MNCTIVHPFYFWIQQQHFYDLIYIFLSPVLFWNISLVFERFVQLVLLALCSLQINYNKNNTFILL